jgi:hypothetical protein
MIRRLPTSRYRVSVAVLNGEPATSRTISD